MYPSAGRKAYVCMSEGEKKNLLKEALFGHFKLYCISLSFHTFLIEEFFFLGFC